MLFRPYVAELKSAQREERSFFVFISYDFVM